MFQDPDIRQFYDLWSSDQRIATDERPYDPCCWIDYHEINNGFAPVYQSDGSFHQRIPGTINSESPMLRAQDREELIHYIKNTESPKWSEGCLVCCTLRNLWDYSLRRLRSCLSHFALFSFSALTSILLCIARERGCWSPCAAYMQRLEWTRFQERPTRRYPGF